MIREAGKADFDKVFMLEAQVYDLHLAAYPDMISPKLDQGIFREYYEDCLDGINGKTFVYELDGEVLGYCVTRKREIKNHRLFFDMIVLELDDICVDQKARGKQVGKRLFEAAKSYADEIGASRMELTVWEFNKHARHFFELQGMTPRLTRMELAI